MKAVNGALQDPGRAAVELRVSRPGSRFHVRWDEGGKATTLGSLAFLDNEWITQAEAARLRGISHQGDAKLIKQQRLGTLEIGGRRFVRRHDDWTADFEEFVRWFRSRVKKNITR